MPSTVAGVAGKAVSSREVAPGRWSTVDRKPKAASQVQLQAINEALTPSTDSEDEG